MPASMDAFDVVRQLNARQNNILEALPPNLLAEYREIQATIRYIDGLLYENGKHLRLPLTPQLIRLLSLADKPVPKSGRISLAHRREALCEYLQSAGPTTRAQILSETRMPPGTLSALLNEEGFEKTGDGLWTVKEKVTH